MYFVNYPPFRWDHDMLMSTSTLLYQYFSVSFPSVLTIRLMQIPTLAVLWQWVGHEGVLKLVGVTARVIGTSKYISGMSTTPVDSGLAVVHLGTHMTGGISYRFTEAVGSPFPSLLSAVRAALWEYEIYNKTGICRNSGNKTKNNRKWSKVWGYFMSYTFCCALVIQDWSLRLLMERSRAIKCPNIQHFLVGMKKVQQMVATSGVVQQYLSDPGAVQRVTDTFVGFHSLDEVQDTPRNIHTTLPLLYLKYLDTK